MYALIRGLDEAPIVGGDRIKSSLELVPNFSQLAKHRMTHLNPEERKDYRCSFCHIMFDTVKLRERHEERHRDGEVFACESCGRVFKNEKNLTHHIKMHHVEKTDVKKQVEKKKVSECMTKNNNRSWEYDH